MLDVAVVGAGPAGSSTAMEAARRGLKVALLEEHPSVGRPLHCAGLLHQASFEQTGLKVPSEVVDAWISRVCIYTGLGEPLVEPFKLRALVVDRAKFDQWLSSLAVEAGAELKTSCRAVGGARVDGGWRLKLSGWPGALEAELLVAADGVGGSTLKLAGLAAAKEVASCLQYEVEGVEVEDPERLDLYFSGSLAPGGYAWVIPLESKRRVRVGLGVRRASRPAKHFLDSFVKKLFGHVKPVECYGGCVPVGGPIKPSYAEAFLAVGDAAGFANPLTGAGIVGAVTSGSIAGRIASEACPEGFTAASLASYEEECWRRLGKGYMNVLRARRDLERLSSRDVKDLIRRAGLVEDLRARRYLKAFVKVMLHKPSLAAIALRAFKVRDYILR
jgi:geranylgeranyl reductase family protein